MKTVLAHGVFDLLHSGHIAHLMQCKSFGDYLIVSVVADVFVSKPQLIDSQLDRVFKVNALRCVDHVVLCEAPGPEYLLRRLKPCIYVRNDEYVRQHTPEYVTCRELGIQVGFTKTTSPHTSDLIQRIKAIK